MNLIYTLVIIIAALLVLIVLIQNSKGGGISSNFASNTQVVGVKRQAEMVEKITWWLAGIMLFLCIISASMGKGEGTTVVKDEQSAIKNAPSKQTTPGSGAPILPNLGDSLK